MLKQYRTYSLEKDKGGLLGLEGDYFMFPVITFFAGLLINMFLGLMTKQNILFGLGAGLFPTVVVYIYLKKFISHKPPHFQEDYFEQIFGENNTFEMNDNYRGRTPENATILICRTDNHIGSDIPVTEHS